MVVLSSSTDWKAGGVPTYMSSGLHTRNCTRTQRSEADERVLRVGTELMTRTVGQRGISVICGMHVCACATHLFDCVLSIARVILCVQRA